MLGRSQPYQRERQKAVASYTEVSRSEPKRPVWVETSATSRTARRPPSCRHKRRVCPRPEDLIGFASLTTEQQQQVRDWYASQVRTPPAWGGWAAEMRARNDARLSGAEPGTAEAPDTTRQDATRQEKARSILAELMPYEAWGFYWPDETVHSDFKGDFRFRQR